MDSYVYLERAGERMDFGALIPDINNRNKEIRTEENEYDRNTEWNSFLFFSYSGEMCGTFHKLHVYHDLYFRTCEE